MSKRKKAFSHRSHGRARRQSRSVRPISSVPRSVLLLCVVGGCVVLAAIIIPALLSPSHRGDIAASLQAERLRLRRQVAAVFAGIPQHGALLGQPMAPVTLQVFVDLEDNREGTTWFDVMLPPILETFVRPRLVRLEFRSMK